MRRLRLRPAFVATGCNRVVHALEWGECGLVAYAGANAVCIYDPEADQLVASLVGHTGRVNCVKWIPAAACGPSHGLGDNQHLLVSGAADGTLRVWAWLGETGSPQWVCLHTLEGHTRPVTSIAIQPLGSSNGATSSSSSSSSSSGVNFLLAATSGGEEVLIWHCCAQLAASASNPDATATALTTQLGPGAWQLEQRIHVGTQTALCVDIAAVPGAPPGWLLLATGAADNAVRIYVRPPGGEFEMQCRLVGHENWVRSVAFTAAREEAPSAAAAGGDGKEQAGGGEKILLLTSASQDRYARIWRIGCSTSTLGAAGSGATTATAASAPGSGALAEMITRYAPRPHVTVAGRPHWCTLESLLVGHEDWIHSISWRPWSQIDKLQAAATASGATSSDCSPPRRGALCLLTASQDRTMLLWRCDVASGLWLSEASVGDAGATCLGYFGGVFSPCGHRILAHGFTGALHLWLERERTASTSGSGVGGGGGCTWLPRHACGGHFGPVTDLCWGADGRCVQSVSADQTARLFTAVGGKWCELARTQVHGHDFSCIASIPLSSSSDAGGNSKSYMYVSGSEEKVLRVFEAPLAFLDSLDLARGHPAGTTAAALGVRRRGAPGSAPLVLGAAVGALALTNKAVLAEEAPSIQGDTNGANDASGGAGSGLIISGDYPEGPDMLPRAMPSAVDGPPLEEHLSQNTLWPEIRKLYGHGNDVYCVAASPCGRLLASACRAQAAASADVWLWEVGTWRALGQLPAHALTVTQLVFSPSGRLLLSGSRDRSFAVWRINSGSSSSGGVGGGGTATSEAAGKDAVSFELVARVKAAHARIIWGVSWSHDEGCFATCSRDHTVRLWHMGPAGPATQPAATLPEFPCPVTAVSLAPAHVAASDLNSGCSSSGGGSYVCAVGLEDGGLQLWTVPVAPPPSAAVNGSTNGEAPSSNVAAAAAPQLLWAATAGDGHAGAVRRIAWAPNTADGAPAGSPEGAVGPGSPVMIASCGDDHAVRVYEVDC